MGELRIAAAALLLGLLGLGKGAVDPWDDADLPGMVGDARGLPNMPFTVDTNRVADGISSTSPYSVSSPSFPSYFDALSNDLGGRRDHAALLAASREEQGIAEYGAGGSARENAYVDMVARENASADPFGTKPSRTFTVHASQEWNPSSMAIQDGVTYKISVEAGASWSDGGIAADTTGYETMYNARKHCFTANDKCYKHLKQRRRFKHAQWFELVCGVADSSWQLYDVAFEKDRYMPLREDRIVETLFAVGAERTLVAQHTGELICFANDAQGGYFNNFGSVNVTVTREDWPPAAPTLIYQDQR
uniref:Uncharacterized protein n=1 Tax=Phaeomonas parva TaxID=124430 RepID=A0A7S1XUQ3_9STRA|mmetsp:Transcript_36084/g.113301  ORF Transcript_36084/g.113301 Transcript_36084/m.113301 type:complete len:305 (+) Transcript_36084:211-1125(+)